MNKFEASIFLLLIVNVCVTFGGFFTIIGPRTVQYGDSYKALLTAFDDKDAQLKVTLTGKNSNDEVYKKELKKLSTQEIIIDLSRHPHIENFTLKAIYTSKSGKIFTQSEEVIMIPKKHSVFIQTDKPVYKAGDDVLYRILVLNSEMKPATFENIEIEIFDGNGNKMALPLDNNKVQVQVEDDSAEDDKETLAVDESEEKPKETNNLIVKRNGMIAPGLYSYYFPLSDDPIEGNWSIKATIDNETKLATVQYFKVAEYILPRFEVVLETERDVRSYDEDIYLTVSAKYTFGEYVKGTAKITAKVYDSEHLGNVLHTISKEVNVNPKTIVQFNIKKDLKLFTILRPAEVAFNVRFTEELTGQFLENITKVRVAQEGEFMLDIVREKKRFKPGFPYKIEVFVRKMDGYPITKSSEVRLDLTYHMKMPKCKDLQEIENYKYPIFNSVRLSNLKDGKVKFLLEIPANATAFNATVSFKQNKKSFNVLRLDTVTREYLNIKKLKTPKQNKIPKIGDTVTILVEGSAQPYELNFIVIGPKGISKHQTFDEEDFNQNDDKLSFEFSFKVTNSMAPLAHVIVFYIQGSGEVIYDQLMIEMSSPSTNHLSVQFTKAELKPGQDCSLHITSSQDSFVALLGVDLSVTLMGTGNDIDRARVTADMKLFSNELYGASFASDKKYSDLHESNALMITNANAGNYNCVGMRSPVDNPNFDDDDESGLRDHNIPASSSDSQIRNFFPETWIFNEYEMDRTGKHVIKAKVPDTITTFTVRGFSIHPTQGLAISKLATILVKKDFFIKLYIPYAIRIGEVLKVDVSVFNYLPDFSSDVNAIVKMIHNKDDFEFVKENAGCKFTSLDNGDKTSSVTVPKGTGKSVFFLIRSKKIGLIKIRIHAKTSDNSQSDAVEKVVIVKPEGYKKIENKAILVDLRENRVFTDIPFDIAFSENYKENSVKIESSAIGDLLGPAMKMINIQKLLEMPHGCTEQEFKRFIPNVVVMQYLKSMHKLSGAFRENGEKYLAKGYQMILKRRLPDGSFRLWSEGKDASVWLTAYVAKILAHTKKFVEVEDKMIYSALNFIKSLQSPEGRWSDANIGTYYYISQTGSQKSYALNAFIVISFLENEAHKKEFKTTIEDAMTYLSSHITEVRDNHAIAMIAYAAALNNQNVFADQLLTKLNETANIANDKMWWFREDPGNPTESVPVQVEIAAYTVMALVKSNRAVAAMKIVNWLLTKRNQNGGFISTTDTVIGIQALAMFATAVNSAEMKMDIEINNQVKYHINETNALQLQHKDLLPTTKRISIEAKGVGFAYLQITTSYDVIATAPTQQFRVSVQAVPNNLKLQLNICASFIAKGEQKNSRMSLMEIFLPSGYEFDSEASKPSISSAGVKQTETHQQNNFIVLYFSGFTTAEKCLNIHANRKYIVEDLKKSVVSVYDYYAENTRGSAFYSIAKPCGI